MFDKIIIISFCAVLFVSCKSNNRLNKDFNYFQKLDSITKSIKYEEPLISTGDNLTIQVIASSLAQQDASVFNMVGASTTQVVNGVPYSSGSLYQIDKLGFIEMPKLGKIKLEGLNKKQAEELIVKKLIASELVKEPVVIVKYTNFKVNVLGEVKKPGVQMFSVEKVNILEAISEAGDLTEFGKREDIIVMRQVGEKWESYKIDLKNTEFFLSPVFYLRNNDFVYIPANDTKLKQIKYNPNVQKDIAIASSILQTLFFLTQAALVVRSFR